jgi:hypothetical protein
MSRAFLCNPCDLSICNFLFIYLLVTIDMTLFYSLLMFSTIMFIVLFDYILSIVGLLIYYHISSCVRIAFIL